MQTPPLPCRVMARTSAHGTPGHATLVWTTLIAATLLTWTIGDHGAAGPAVAGMLLLIALGKGSLIILEYMALRRAPLMWPLLTLGWMGFVCALIGFAYWKGLGT